MYLFLFRLLFRFFTARFVGFFEFWLFGRFEADSINEECTTDGCNNGQNYRKATQRTDDGVHN